MADNDDILNFTVTSLIEDVLLEHGEELCNVYTSHKSDAKISTKRYEATRWLRKMVGVVAAKDLPAEPSEQNFRMGLRSGIILCNVLKKIEPGSISKVVEAPCDSVVIPDGAPLSQCPYFENIRNFLLVIEERRLPTFEACDLEQGGKLSRVVNCVLALMAYSEWKKAGAKGTFKFEGNPKPSTERKQMVCNSLDMDKCCDLWKEDKEKPVHMRVRDLLSDQKPEDIPVAVEIVLSKLAEAFERRLTSHREKVRVVIANNKKKLQEREALLRARNAEIKPSPKDTSSDTNIKSKTNLKKEEFLKPLAKVNNNEKEENASSETTKKEETKSFSSIMNEMRKKANADIKNPSEVNNEMDRRATIPAKKSVADMVYDQKEKNTTTDTIKSTGNIKNETKNKENISTSLAINEMKDNATIDTMESTSDINDEIEEDEIIDDESISDVEIEMEEDETIDDTLESTSNDDDSLQKKETEWRKEMEKKETERKIAVEKKKEVQRKRDIEKKKEMERQAAEDAKEEEYYNWVNGECERLKLTHAKQERLVDHQHKEIQALKNTFSATKADMELLRTNYQEEVNNLGKHISSLAQAASGYKKVVDENRRLYNQVQDLKGSIRVYCRSRPFLPGTQGKKPSSVDCIDDVTMEVITSAKGGKEQRKSFTFNRVFGPTATQSSVYTDTQPLIRSVLDGYNICIFAYGQTGSGKTFTMTGPENLAPETMGVNYRALNDLFDIQQQRKNMIAYEVCVQMLEIYNEMVRDLLCADGASKKLEIRLGTSNGINVPDATLVPVSTTEDVIRLMTLGHKNRAVGSTAMNDRSSRSHSCVTVHVNGKDLTSGSTVRGCMHLVDLAGSERADKTEATGDRLKEATFINKSLSALGDVIASLAQKSTHVPYRNSKLTLLLQDALGGQAKTLMFIHVSPDPDTVGETISTLKFAERVSTVELGAAKSNKDDTDLKQLKEQVAFLKAALAKEGGDTEDACDGGDEEYDDHDGAASESSEADSNPPKAATSAASKLKKVTTAPAKSPQSKTSSATAKKPAAASSSPASKTGRTSTLDSKKKIGK
uniref:kinesin-like protein KIN-14I n=1 Tax=Erigeron canadensis TaxID=72917 RepID=UPI001CB9B725|nr:kinesin-like protein KIN-14I [Erigeron canadensis]